MDRKTQSAPQGDYVIAHADKTVLKIHGLKVNGLNARRLEEMLTERLQSVVRVIGVTGGSIDMDVYGLSGDCILADEAGFIKAVSLCEGITAIEVARISYAEKIVPVEFDDIPERFPDGCAAERWVVADA